MIDVHVFFSFFVAILKQIVSRGNILESETISGVTGTEYIISKQITADMSPKSKLIVYFLTDAGEVVLDSLEFVVNVVFANPVRTHLNCFEPDRTGFYQCFRSEVAFFVNQSDIYLQDTCKILTAFLPAHVSHTIHKYEHVINYSLLGNHMYWSGTV